MKKHSENIYGYLFYLAVIALPFTFASGCGTDDAIPAGGDMVEVTVRAAIDSGYENLPRTYASGGGGLSNVDGSIYCVRYILEAWTDAAQPELAGRWSATGEIGAAAPELSPRLLQGTYTFVIWADFVLKADIDLDNPVGKDLYYITGNDLRNITLAGDYAINVDAKDAYAGTVPADLTAGGANFNISLTRPLAKVRLIAEDAPASLAGYKSSLSYGAAIFDSYDALTAEASSSGTATVYGLFECSAETGLVAFDYLFVNADGMTADVTLTVTDDSNTIVAGKTLAAMPFRRNCLTTITGNLFVVQP